MAEPKYDIVLKAHRRGTRFKYSSSLGNGWTAAMLTGGMLFTLRDRLPKSTVVDDTDSHVIGQASLTPAPDQGSITFTSDTDFEVVFEAETTHGWPIKNLYWDCQAKVTAGSLVHDVAAGTVKIEPDITRTK